jgi:hypothetical protein
MNISQFMRINRRCKCPPKIQVSIENVGINQSVGYQLKMKMSTFGKGISLERGKIGH